MFRHRPLTDEIFFTAVQLWRGNDAPPPMGRDVGKSAKLAPVSG